MFMIPPGEFLTRAEEVRILLASTCATLAIIMLAGWRIRRAWRQAHPNHGQSES